MLNMPMVSPRGTERQRMRLADFLCRRLREVGCTHMFGVPGDFNLGLLNRVIESPVEYVGCCNELNAAYAADGCARVMGIAACVTTYAVGELSAMNGVAGAYAESVPVVKITGAPARKFYAQQVLLHHTMGDYLIPFNAYKQITVDQCLLDDPRTAARQIDRCLKSCLRYKQPVYIVVPSDMVDEELEFEVSPADKPGAYGCPIEWLPTPPEQSHPQALTEAVGEILERLAQAQKPLFIPGVELIRRDYRDTFKRLTDRSKVPYVTMLLAKGILDEDHPNFVGLYQGARSRPEVSRLVQESDCIVIIGEKLSDLNTGGFTAPFSEQNRILINFDNITIKSHKFNKVYIHDVLEQLLERIPARDQCPYEFARAHSSCVIRADLPKSPVEQFAGAASFSFGNEKLTMRNAFKVLAKYLEEDMVLIAETGASMFATAETLLPRRTVYIGQTFYGSIGYTVGALLGVAVALRHENKGRKCMLVVGDGSFQLTCQEISTMIRLNLTPTIILINNDGYLIERVITDNTYNDIQMWKYAKLPEIFGGEPGVRCNTPAEFEHALRASRDNPHKLHFIEAVFDKWDCNILLKAAGRAMALNNNLEPSITEDMLLEHPPSPS